MASVAAAESGFSIGAVVSRTFAVLGRHFVLFLLLGLIAVIPQELFTSLIVPPAAVNGAAVATSFAAGHWLTVAGAWLVSIVLAFLLQASVAYGTVMDLSDQPTSFANALMTAIRSFFPLLALSIVYTVAIGFGFALLIVPGFMLMTAWAVAVPTLVVERTGVFGSLGRSGTLTKGHRWAILGLLVIFFVGAVIAQLAVRPIFGLSLFMTGHLPVAYFVVDGFVRAVIAIVEATGIACIYFELRSEKEGIGPQQLASVFD